MHHRQPNDKDASPTTNDKDASPTINDTDASPTTNDADLSPVTNDKDVPSTASDKAVSPITDKNDVSSTINENKKNVLPTTKDKDISSAIIQNDVSPTAKEPTKNSNDSYATKNVDISNEENAGENQYDIDVDSGANSSITDKANVDFNNRYSLTFSDIESGGEEEEDSKETPEQFLSAADVPNTSQLVSQLADPESDLVQQQQHQLKNSNMPTTPTDEVIDLTLEEDDITTEQSSNEPTNPELIITNEVKNHQGDLSPASDDFRDSYYHEAEEEDEEGGENDPVVVETNEQPKDISTVDNEGESLKNKEVLPGTTQDEKEEVTTGGDTGRESTNSEEALEMYESIENESTASDDVMQTIKHGGDELATIKAEQDEDHHQHDQLEEEKERKSKNINGKI